MCGKGRDKTRLFAFHAMKIAFYLLPVALVIALVHAANAQGSWQLRGIVNLPGIKQALLVTNSPSRTPSALLILSENERENKIKLQTINTKKSSAELLVDGNPIEVKMEHPSSSTLEPGIAMDRAPLDQILRVYAELAHRTILRYPNLVAEEFSFQAGVSSVEEAVRVFDKAFAEKGFSVIPDGEHFVMLVPKTAVTKVHPHAPPSNSSDPDLLPAGVICLYNVDLREAAKIYVELLNRKLNPEAFGFSGLINLRSATALSRQEAIYALETLFAWNGVKLVPDGDKFVKPVALQ